MRMKKHEIYVGVDLGGTNIKAGWVSSDGKIILEQEIPTGVDEGVETVIDRIEKLVCEMVQQVGKDYDVKSMGIGMPGQIDVKQGIFIEGPNMPGWQNVELVAILRNRFKFPVMMDNDANVAALGEAVFGAGQGATELLMITLGTGVGGGLILRGKVYRGATDVGGEFGHTIIQFNGPVCGCGRRGCIEAFIGTRGILNRLKEKLESGRDSLLSKIVWEQIMPKDISEAAEKGDEVALEVLRDTGYYLGVAMASVVNLLNLEKIVVGGGVARAGDLIMKPARVSLDQYVLEVSGKTVQVVEAKLGSSAGLIGAAQLAMMMDDNKD